MKKLFDLALKDLRRTVSNLFGLVMVIGAPFLITGLIYFAFGGVAGSGDSFSMQPIRTEIVNLDAGSSNFNAGDELTDFLLSESLEEILVASQASNEAQARAAVDEQRMDVAVLIPAGFTADAIGGRSEATITLYQDPTLTLAPQILRDLIGQFTDAFAGAKISVDVVEAQFKAHGLAFSQQDAQAVANSYAGMLQSEDHDHSRPDSGSIQIIKPGSTTESDQGGAVYIAPVMAGMMIFFVFFMGANGAQSIISEDEEGTLSRLFTTPTARGLILGGKLLSIILILILQTSVLLVASSLLFGISWGQPIAVLLASLSMILAAAGFGVLIMSFLKTTRQTGPVLGGVLTVTGMLGGLFTTGIPNPPAFLDQAKLAMPQGWALEAWQKVLGGAPLQTVLTPVIVLSLIGLVFFVTGAAIFRRRFS